MRHRKSGRKLGRTPAHRKAMFGNMVTSLLRHERIRTTDARAKDLRRVAERLITMAKKAAMVDGDEAAAIRVHYLRQARKWVNDREVLVRLFDDYAQRYAARPGGYTRVMKLGRRPGDNAPMSLIELVDRADAPVEAPSTEDAESSDE